MGCLRKGRCLDKYVRKIFAKFVKGAFFKGCCCLVGGKGRKDVG